jgi:DNA-binding PucR family transcriptional regulator
MRAPAATPPTHESRAGIGETLAGINAELDDVARSLTDTIHEHLDELDDELWVDTLHSVRSNLGLLTTMLGEGTEPSRAVPPPEALAYAKEYARRGLSFELLQRAYRTAQAAFSRMWLERLRTAASGPDAFADSVGFFNDWLFTWIEALERQLTGVYMAERERWVRGSAAARAEQVRAVLDGGALDVADAGRRLGYELRRRHLAYVVWGDDAAPDGGDGSFGEMERLAAAVAEAAGSRSQLAVALGRHLACWTALGARGSAAADLPARLDGAFGGSALRVAVGLPGEGLEGFRRSHREALLARRAAESLGHAGCCISYEQAALDVLLTQDVDEARRFALRRLGPLAQPGEQPRRVARTLEVFLEEGSSFARTARRLGVHENTVAYRIRRAEELLGHRVAERQLELQVALRLAPLADGGSASAPRRG